MPIGRYDQTPSQNEYVVFERKNQIYWMLRVGGLGYIVLKAQGKEFKGLATFTDDEVNFNLDGT